MALWYRQGLLEEGRYPGGEMGEMGEAVDSEVDFMAERAILAATTAA